MSEWWLGGENSTWGRRRPTKERNAALLAEADSSLTNWRPGLARLAFIGWVVELWLRLHRNGTDGGGGGGGGGGMSSKSSSVESTCVTPVTSGMRRF